MIQLPLTLSNCFDVASMVKNWFHCGEKLVSLFRREDAQRLHRGVIFGVIYAIPGKLGLYGCLRVLHILL